LDTTFPFTLSGTVSGGQVSGELILTDDQGTSYTTPFDGTGRSGSTLNARFDYTHHGDFDLRIKGSWTADPQ